MTRVKSKNSGRKLSNFRSKKIPLAILLIVIVAVSIVTILILSERRPSITPILHTTEIVNGVATVNADSYVDYAFNIPSDATSVSVAGTFSVQGTSLTNITVYIFDSTNFNHYENGQNYIALYQSGETSSALISASISSNGNYYLVLDNDFSTTSQKTVNIQSDVAYYTK